MSLISPITDLLNDLLHPGAKPEADDPTRPFTPPPSLPSKDEDDDDDGPSFPLNPALA